MLIVGPAWLLLVDLVCVHDRSRSVAQRSELLVSRAGSGESAWSGSRRRAISRARGPLFLSESRRNHAEPLSLWTWSKVVRRIALAAGVPRFSTHTTRHLCLTDLTRMGWELHAIAIFAGHRSTEVTLTYIHLSGRDLAEKLNRGMEQIHGWRVEMLARLGERMPGAIRP